MIRRGELWWADLDDGKRRPVVLLTRDATLPSLTNVTVAPCTRTSRGIDTEVELTPAEHGVDVECVVSCDNIQTIEQSRLFRRINLLDVDTMNAVDEAVRVALGLP